MTDPGDKHQQNDIVTDLRRRHANVTGIDTRITTPIVGPTIFSQAADEIERLRVEVQLCRRILPKHIERVIYEGEG